MGFQNPELDFTFGSEKQEVSSLIDVESANGVFSEQELFLEVDLKNSKLNRNMTIIQNYTLHLQKLENFGDFWEMTTFQIFIKVDEEDTPLLLKIDDEISCQHYFNRSNFDISFIADDQIYANPEFFKFGINFKRFEILTFNSDKIDGNGVVFGLSVGCVILAVVSFTILKLSKRTLDKIPVQDD